ncbi:MULTISPECIES: hypothetical protein [unclassified Roseofilum]|uniref:hypothetical protein n=1 Tax=unclassified Roseofilum TaxID=2620099 RepID=UPI000E93037E|nr:MULTISPECIES: hypothetical protein [unclassified Roseofilum]MBP0010136.1 hypothetical protein [Roseofilum sp. Belize Diploria]MBP0032057.1 hypothetical protein [Roseofilum sp. Belize BBD 4]HBQ98608.1 hypothetical protein [Cyanobacteria bacterium UBA11691]
MSLYIYKPIDNPQHISILFPTRNRTHYLDNLFDSLEENTGEKELVDIWIYVDHDDLVTIDYLESGMKEKYSFGIHYVVGDLTVSQGEMSNILREKCTTNPGIYGIGGDKLLFVTPGWDTLVREEFNKYPDRIAFVSLTDSYHDKHFGAYGFLSAEWLNQTGRFLSEYFPFWGDDLCINQVASIIGRNIQLDARVKLQGGKGKTARLRNWLFWKRFFNDTLIERVEEAEQLRKIIYPEKNADYYQNLEEGNKIISNFQNYLKFEPEDEIIALELRCSSPETLKSQPNEHYLLNERRAIERLKQILGRYLQQGNLFAATRILLHILGSYHFFKEYEYQRVLWIANFRWVFRLYNALNRPSKYSEYAFCIYRWLKQLLSKSSTFIEPKS